MMYMQHKPTMETCYDATVNNDELTVRKSFWTGQAIAEYL